MRFEKYKTKAIAGVKKHIINLERREIVWQAQ
jgi:hypothetical protein